jgi:hypothetical protein
MKKINWEEYLDEDITDEINLIFQVMKKVRNDISLSERDKQITIDECLDKLNLYYEEQRKRGTFKSYIGTT